VKSVKGIRRGGRKWVGMRDVWGSRAGTMVEGNAYIQQGIHGEKTKGLMKE